MAKSVKVDSKWTENWINVKKLVMELSIII